LGYTNRLVAATGGCIHYTERLCLRLHSTEYRSEGLAETLFVGQRPAQLGRYKKDRIWMFQAKHALLCRQNQALQLFGMRVVTLLLKHGGKIARSQ